MSTICDIVTSIVNFFDTVSSYLGLDLLFIIALAVEAVLVIFFLIKSAFSYEATLNRSLDKINYWLFERKVITEENIQEFNMVMKTKAPKRLCYFWQQYILFREGTPSSYMSTENLIEKPLKTSSYNSNIKNLNVISTLWMVIVTLFMIIGTPTTVGYLTAEATKNAILVVGIVVIINVIFTIYLRARKNAILNSLYQNVALFGRFMDNACVDLPTYIDYQILFTPAEIEKGQPVLREFLDYKARREKEEFNKAKEDEVEYEKYDFSSTGVNGSIVLDRAMKESEKFLNKREKIYVKIAQLESELDTRKKNFDNVQKDFQNKLQTSRENVEKLRQQQEETTNRIESNYLRKQQTQEIAKQEQLEAEFEQQRAKYLLEKNECENEIKGFNEELEACKQGVENAMLGEYQTFFDKFCKSAEKVVSKVFADKINNLKEENEKSKEYITELEIKLKNSHQGSYDATSEEEMEGKYDEEGNYVYPNGSFYDKDGLFHDENGNIYDAEGKLISQKIEEQPKDEKKVVDFNDFDAFEFLNDIAEKNDVYSVAENIIENVDTDNDIEIVHSNLQDNPVENLVEQQAEQKSDEEVATDETVAQEETASKKKAGRPRKIVASEPPVELKKRGRPRKIVQEEQPKRKVGRPKKNVEAPVKRSVGRPKKETEPVKRPVGRPKKVVEQTNQPKRKVGRPRKTEVQETIETPKKRGRPKKQLDSIVEINKKLSEEEVKLNEMRDNLNKEFESAIKNLNENESGDNQTRKEEIFKEIEKLQSEANKIKNGEETKTTLEDLNAKLEQLISEVQKFNS